MFTEYRRTVHRQGPPQFVHVDDLAGLYGFRGVYAVAAETAEAICRHGDITPLSNTPVWADTLFIDYDGDAGSEQLEEDLQKEGLGYSLWSTGRRGVHFHIPTEPTISLNLPARHLQWVERNADGAWDRTVYRATSIIRLPGTWHEKAAGQRKTLLRQVEGKRLEVPKREEREISRVKLRSSALHSVSSAEFYTALCRKAKQRNTHVYYLGRLSKECGVPYHDALDAVVWWAERVCQPVLDVPRQELERQFENGRRSA